MSKNITSFEIHSIQMDLPKKISFDKDLTQITIAQLKESILKTGLHLENSKILAHNKDILELPNKATLYECKIHNNTKLFYVVKNVNPMAQLTPQTASSALNDILDVKHKHFVEERNKERTDRYLHIYNSFLNAYGNDILEENLNAI